MIRRRTVCIGLLLIFSIASGFAAGHSEIADAVMRADNVAVRELLARKVDVNSSQVGGATALHWAVYRDDLETSRLLISAGAKVDARNREGITPLAMASLYGSVSLRNGSGSRQR